MSGHHHRSLFKQKNKPFKGKSKGKNKRTAGGKLGKRSIKSVTTYDAASRKADRVNRAKQRQRQKRQEQIMANRVGKRGQAPKIIGVLSLSGYASCQELQQQIYTAFNDDKDDGQQSASSSSSTKSSNNVPTSFHIKLDNRRHHIHLVVPSSRTRNAVLDVAKVADVLVLVMAPHPSDPTSTLGVDAFGVQTLRLIKAQGLPTVIGVMQNPGIVSTKHENSAKKLHSKWLQSECPEANKSIFAVTPNTGVNGLSLFMRWCINQRLRPIQWREQRSYMCVQELAVAQGDTPDKVLLSATGYLRGRSLSANQLVHVTGFGDFAIRCVYGVGAPAVVEVDEMKVADANGPQLLGTADPAVQESLDALEELDDTAVTYLDQSIITDEELAAAEADQKKRKGRTANDAWSAALQLDDEDYGEEDQVDEKDAMMDGHDDDEDDGTDTLTMGTGQDDEISMQDIMAKRKQLEQDEVDFPDEVETPLNIPAKQRFARYRGLKSFRNSRWNPYEQLPVEYSRIVAFQNFDVTAKRILEETASQSSNIASGQQVQIHMVVPTSVAQNMVAAHTSGSLPLCLWGLYSHEQKASVLHFLVKRYSTDADVPVKGKDPMEIHCGFRRFVAQPVYSQNSQGIKDDKHLIERYLQHGRFTMASVYGKVMFPPAPVLMFRQTPPPQVELNPLVASGTLHSVNPKRILVKRIVLTGYPINVSRRAAVVRYMFFNPEDIEYFKPVELHTKYGATGHIKEPRGTKGYMKCTFSTPIKQHDIVCMSLYKRQFPPFRPQWFEAPQ